VLFRSTQGGTTWQSEMYWPASLLEADMLTADTMATRRTWEQLARQAKEVLSLRPYADAAQAAYLTLRGELDRAIELYEKLLPALPVHQAMSWLPTRAYFAQALNLAGQHARAKRVLVDALAQTDPKDAIVAMHFSEVRRQLALAEAGLGDRERAEAILDALFEMYGPLDNPLLLGLFHKARAEIALGARDPANFAVHLARMHHCFRATENPALIAQWEQLGERAVLAGFRPSVDPKSRDPQSIEPVSLGQALTALNAAANRHDCALRLTLQRARSVHGYLYLLRADAVQLVEAVGGTAPPAELELELTQAIQRFAADDDEDGVTTIATLTDPPSQRPAAHRSMAAAAANSNMVADSQLDPSSTVFVHSTKLRKEDGFQMLVLSTRRNGQRTVVGGMLVEMSASEVFRLDNGFRGLIAEALCELPATSRLPDASR
jgi:tetratricopeptide (TPR) repeat protein